MIDEQRQELTNRQLFKKHRVIKFPDMILMELCKFGFKLANSETPEPSKVTMESRGGKKLINKVQEVIMYLIFTYMLNGTS